MANQAPSVVIKRIEAQIRMSIRRINLRKLNERERDRLAKLGQALSAARIYSGDYELSETRDEQIANAKRAKNYLDQAHQLILKASEFNIFDAIEVAYLSAQIDQIQAELK